MPRPTSIGARYSSVMATRGPDPCHGVGFGVILACWRALCCDVSGTGFTDQGESLRLSRCANDAEWSGLQLQKIPMTSTVPR
jgi:hypothetical protein